MANKKTFIASLSYVMILVIFINLSVSRSPLIGAIASTAYFLLNATLLGLTFFEDETGAIRLLMGGLLLVVILGLVGWVVMIVYNLDVLRLVITLCIVTTLSFFMAVKIRRAQPNPKPQTYRQWRIFTRFSIVRLLYLSMIVLSFYLLFMSRSGEAHTVWEVMHPAFVPVFFATTFLLLMTIFSSEEIKYKLLFIIIHSVLSHTFFSIIFPAGDVGGQQVILGATRLVFENILFHGLGWPQGNALLQIYYWTKGDNLQTAFSVIFARMFAVDVLWSHLLLIPVLWGIFVPVIAFIVTKTLGAKENVSILSSLLISSFPVTIYWGAISVYNSLGYIFFFGSLYFFLKYLSSDDPRTFFLMLTFSIVTFLSHFLTGFVSFSLLLLTMTLKRHEKEKDKTPRAAKLLLLLAFILGASVLPLALVYRGTFYSQYAYFSLGKLSGLSTEDIVWLFLLGEHINFDIKAALIYGIGPLIGFLGMIYCLNLKQRPNNNRVRTLLLLLGFLMILVDYRILKLFMMNVPFTEERLWTFRDFMVVPFVPLVVEGAIVFLQKKSLKTFDNAHAPNHPALSAHVRLKSVATYVLVCTLLSGWVIGSVYYAYPHYGPLQTTSYEIEAVKYIDVNTNGSYIVIGDQWIIYAGQVFVGTYNTRAFYFSHIDPRGTELYAEMKNNPSIDTLSRATTYNNATVAYFIIEEPRLGAQEFDRLLQQARQNGLPIYRTFGDGKLYVFYYEKSV